MIIKTQFNHLTDRYAFDFHKCSVSKGYAQVDTRQDASYYGNWANPFTLTMVEYAEGDITIKTAESQEEFIEAMLKFKEWANKISGFIGVDPGFDKKLKERFETLGLSSLLH